MGASKWHRTVRNARRQAPRCSAGTRGFTVPERSRRAQVDRRQPHVHGLRAVGDDATLAVAAAVAATAGGAAASCRLLLLLSLLLSLLLLLLLADARLHTEQHSGAALRSAQIHDC